MPRIKFGYNSMKFAHCGGDSFLLEMLNSETLEDVKAGIKAFEDFVKRAERIGEEEIGDGVQLMVHEGEEV